MNHLVKERHNGIRLDRLLVEVCPELERPSVQRLIRSGLVTIDGAVVSRPGTRLKPGMEIQIAGVLDPVGTEKGLIQKPHPPTVIADTEAFMVLSKPAGIAMHPAGNSRQYTISDWISTTYPQLIGVGEYKRRPGMVHRLDKDTSGLVLIAKTNRSFKALKKLFQERKIEKTYFAVVYGNVAEPSGIIEIPIGRVKGSKRRGVPAGNRAFGGELREARTEYALHTRYPQYDYLSIKPKTGRTHQIRVHLAALGHPIVGDRLYRFKEHRQDPLKPPFHLLHAGELCFTLGKRKYRYLAPLPRYFADVLKMLDAEARKGYDWNA